MKENEMRTYSEIEYRELQNQLEEMRNKWEQAEQALKDFEYRTKVGAFVKSLGLKNDIYEKYVTDLIAEKGLKFNGEKLMGADDAVDEFRDSYPEAFKSSEPFPEFSVNTAPNCPYDDNAFVRSVMGIK